MIVWLRIGAVLMFLGRAYEYIRWGGPYRDIFYHPQGLGGWYADLIDRPLIEIYNDHFYEHLLSYISDGVGVLFLITAVFLIFYERVPKLKWLIWLASFFLLLHYFGLLYHKNLVQYGIFFEHAAQFAIPWCFLFFADGKKKRAMWWAVIATSVTFFSHGLYAMGYYPQPGHFADMMITGLGMTEDIARTTLTWIGYLDIVFAGLVLITPFSYESKGLKVILTVNIWYAIVWGGLTALARVYTSYTQGMFAHWMDQHLFQTVVRAPHFILPLVIALFYKLGIRSSE